MEIFASKSDVDKAVATLKDMKENTGKLDPQYVKLLNEKLAYSYKDAASYFYERLAEEGLYKYWSEALEVKK